MKSFKRSRRAYGSGVVAAVVAATGLSAAVYGDSVIFDSLTPIVNGVTGQVSTFNSGVPDTYIGGAFNVASGTSLITGIDPCFLNGSNFNGSAFVAGAGSTYTGFLLNVYIWGTVNPLTGNSSSPAFSNLLGERSIVFVGGTFNPGYFYFYGSGGSGAVGTTPVFQFGTPVALNNSNGSATSIGVTYNYEPTTDPIDGTNYQNGNYASMQYTTSIISYNASATTGSTAYNDYFRNAAGETNGNFNLSSTRTITGASSISVATRIFGTTPTTFQWTNASGGSFTDGGNYTPAGPPGTTDTVQFNLSSPVASPYTVSILSLVQVATVNILHDNVVFDFPAFSSQTYFSNSLTVGQSNTATGTTAASLSLTNSTNNITALAEAGNFVIGGNSGTGTLTIGEAIYAYSDADTSISTGSKIVVQQYGSFRTGTLTFGGTTNAWTGQLDIGPTDVIIRNGSIGTVSNQIKQGYANGHWNGQGITSSNASSDSLHLTAVGAIVNNNGTGSQIYGNTSTGTLGLFGGDNPPLNAVLVKYTYYGDANLDGVVDGSDYSKIDASFATEKTTSTSISGWYYGDFNYDGVVDGSDYTLIDNAFNAQSVNSGVSALIRIGAGGRTESLHSDLGYSTATAESTSLGGTPNPSATTTAQIANTSVPEPASLSLLAVGSLAMLGRKSRRVSR